MRVLDCGSDYDEYQFIRVDIQIKLHQPATVRRETLNIIRRLITENYFFN